MESDVITIQELFEFKIDSFAPDGTISGGLRSTGCAPCSSKKFERHGIELPASLFREGAEIDLDAARPGRRPAVKRIAVVVGLAGILAAFAVRHCCGRRLRQAHRGQSGGVPRSRLRPHPAEEAGADHGSGEGDRERRPAGQPLGRARRRRGRRVCDDPRDRRIEQHEGTPIKDAMAAARAFAAKETTERRDRRRRVQQERGDPSPGRPPNKRKIATALAGTPPLGEGTRIYNALEAARIQLEGEWRRGRLDRLLSDGDDVGSTTSEGDIVGRLKNDKVRVFTVGLESDAFSKGALAGLASATGGTSAVAQTTKDLRPLFADLGFRLGNEYLSSTGRSRCRNAT